MSDREAQLALRDEIENGNVGDFAGNDEFEWNNGKWKKEEEFLLKMYVFFCHHPSLNHVHNNLNDERLFSLQKVPYTKKKKNYVRRNRKGEFPENYI